MTTINIGNITDEQMHEIDCECYNVLDRISMLDDCAATYQIHRNEYNEVEVDCYEGFEQFWQISNEVGY